MSYEAYYMSLLEFAGTACECRFDVALSTKMVPKSASTSHSEAN